MSKTKLEFEAGLAAYGKGDFSRALTHWLPLAEAGHTDSQAWVAALHYNAEGAPLDYAAAAVWYKKAAEGGNAFAQNNLAAMYIAGQGVEKNSAEAAKWLTKAAEKSDPYATFNLASLFEKGDGVERNLAKAADYYGRRPNSDMCRHNRESVTCTPTGLALLGIVSKPSFGCRLRHSTASERLWSR